MVDNVSHLPNSVTTSLDNAEIRDLSPVVKRKTRFRHLAFLSATVSVISLIVASIPSPTIPLLAKIIVPYVFYGGIVGTLVFMVLHVRHHKFSPRNEKTKFVPPQKVEEKEDELVIGMDMDTGEPHTLPLKLLTEHMAFCGRSGSGKTTSINYLVYQLLRRNCPVIYFNGKSSKNNVERAVYIAESADALYRMRVIDPDNTRWTHHINPMATSNERGVLANKIIQLLPPASSEGGAAYYRDRTYSYILQLVGILLETKKTFTYADVLACISYTEIAMGILQDELSSRGQHDAIVRLSSDFANINKENDKDAREIRKVMSSIEAQLQSLLALDSGKFISSTTPNMSFKDSIRKGHFVFVQLPMLKDKEQGEKLANVLFLEMREAIGDMYSKGEKLLKPCVVFLEEAASYVQQGMQDMMMQAREAGFCFIPILQVPQSLQKRERGLTPEFMEEVLGNCGLKYWYSISGDEAVQWATRSFGKVIRHFGSAGRAEMSGESGKKFSMERVVNPQKDVRVSVTTSWSEQLDDMVHASTFHGLGYWECISFQEGRLRHIMTNHMFLDVPPGYDLENKVPKLVSQHERPQLLLAERVMTMLRARYSDVQANQMDSDPGVQAERKKAMEGAPAGEAKRARPGETPKNADPWA